jgi:D-sedoheptulose 7-phosphate isomerase
MNNIDRFFVQDPAEFSRSYIAYLGEVIRSIDVRQVAALALTLQDARARGAAIFFIGNGGSAATACHFANDIAIGTYAVEPPFRAISLCDNLATITAIANDFGYEQIFVRQLQVVARPGDVLVAISASGNSPNLLRALEYAGDHGIRTVALTAFDGGKMKTMADQVVHVPTEMKEYGPAEDAHMMLDHLIGAYLMRVVRAER